MRIPPTLPSVAGCAAMLALLVPASAFAAKAKGAGDKAKKEAGAAMEAGNTALATGDVTGAIEAYAKAHDLLPEATGPMVALGLAHEMNGDCAAAVPLLEDYVARKGADARAEAGTALERCRAAETPDPGADPAPGPDPDPAVTTPVDPDPAKPASLKKKPDPVLTAGGIIASLGAVGLVSGVALSARFHTDRSSFMIETRPYRPDPDGPIVAELAEGVVGAIDLCEEPELLAKTTRAALSRAIDLCKRLKTIRTVGWAMGISGGVIALAGVGLMAWSLTKKGTDTPTVAVTPIPGGAFGTVRWTF